MFFKKLYSCWVFFSFAFFFFLAFIPQLLCIPFLRLHFIALRINYIWAWAFFKMACLPLSVEWRFTLDKNQQYILCSNHFSYLDPPALSLFPKPFRFVGKSQLNKIPLFGIMYKYLHITVNRSNFKSRANGLFQARKALNDGFCLGIFPEGGIRFQQFPKMSRFQNGAFQLSVDTGIPIIPVSFPSNFLVFDIKRPLSMSRKICKVIYHSPIFPLRKDEKSVNELKEKVFATIQKELDKAH